MRVILLIFSGLLTGYIVGNLEYKTFEQIIIEIEGKSKEWISSLRIFFVETLNGIEGFDVDQIKINLDSIISSLKDKSTEFSQLDTFEDKVVFIENEAINIINKLSDNLKG